MNKNYILAELKFFSYLTLLNIMFYLCYFATANDTTALLFTAILWVDFFYFIFFLGDLLSLAIFRERL